MAKKKSNKGGPDIEALIANENIIHTDITDEIESSMLTYAIKTIIDRAIPDVRDGLKPVHRRVLYGAHIDGLLPNKGYEKNSGLVGTVMKYFHPHGDGSIYDSVVTMSQKWNYRYPLIDFHGNNGSIDGDPAAAMRYTEGKLDKKALTLLQDIDKQCVNFKPNYSEKTEEPEVLPGLFPNLLCNGASGIATGYTTEIPSHNLTEVINAIIHVIQNPKATLDDLLKFIKGPDFPGGSLLVDNEKIKELYEIGKASLTFKGKYEIEQNDESDNTQIVFTEMPPNVNKPKLIELIHNMCLEEKKIPRVIDVRDESDENGIRIVIELHKTGIADVVINEIYDKTPLQKNNTYILRAIVNQTPKVLSLKEIIEYYIEHRRDVVTRRTQFALTKAKDKLHIQEGLSLVTHDIDKAIKIIKDSDSDKEAKEGLIAAFKLSDIQVNEVLEIKLRQLTKLNQNDILKLIQDLKNEIAKYENVMANAIEVDKIIISELKDLKANYGDDRKTQLVSAGQTMQSQSVTNSNEPIIMVLTSKNNVKHITISAFEDMLKNGNLKERNELFVQGLKCNLSDTFILVLNTGEYVKAEFGDLMGGLDFIESKATVKAIVLNDETTKDRVIVAMTKKGFVKKVPITGFKARTRRVATFFEMQPKDEIIGVRVVNMNDDNVITLATKDGLVHRFFEKSFKNTSAGGKGINGISLFDDNEVIDFDISNQNNDSNTKLILFSKHSDGTLGLKCMPLEEFKPKGRIAQGIKGIEYSKKVTGNVYGMVISDNDFFVTNMKGQIVNYKLTSLPNHNRYNKPELAVEEVNIRKFFIE